MIPISTEKWEKRKMETGIDALDDAFRRWLVTVEENQANSEDGLNAYKHLILVCCARLESNPEDIKALEYRSAAYFRTDRFDKAMVDFNTVVALSPQKPDLYMERARYFQGKHKYSKAINDYSKVIELNPIEICSPFTWRGRCYDALGKREEALCDFNRSIEITPTAEAYTDKVKIYCSMADEDFERHKYRALEDLKKAFKLDFYDEAHYYMGIVLEKMGLLDKNIEPDNSDASFSRGLEYLYEQQRYDDAIREFLKVISINDGLYDKEDMIYEIKIALALKFLQFYEEIKRSKEEERKKIIADLSHSIKNLISTVIDPLENLKQETSVKPQVIENALRGANLIREIVNAVNLSFKGSIDDFRYDTAHNFDADSQDVKAIIMAALRHSVGNMFDGKYFGTFMRKYFPEKSLYTAAKTEWLSLSQSIDINDLLPFLKKYFFKTDFDMNPAEQFIIGNQKGSIIKLMILFQEMILNAVKYSAFIDRENRFLKIHVEASDAFISILVENPFDSHTKVKTSGIGHVIIENFAQLLNTTPVIKTDGGIYSVQIRFQNIWKEIDK